MQITDIPAKFPIPFANNAGASYIRTVPTDHVDATTTDAPRRQLSSGRLTVCQVSPLCIGTSTLWLTRCLLLA